MSGAGRLARALRWLLPVLALALAWPQVAAPARANGVPMLVPLTYLDGLSNWGPQGATGELELSFAESYARLHVSGMPQLLSQRYQGWLVNSESNDAISVGRFNADPQGAIAYEGTLPPIADFGFDLFVITIEPEPDDAPQPTGDRSIGGRFSLVGPPPADVSTPGDVSTTPPAGDATPLPGDATPPPDVSTAPGELPNTGDPTLVTDVARVSLLLAAMALSLFIGVRLGGRRA